MAFPLLVLMLVLFLAFANGANDNFKGVATLLGSGTTSYRAALAWGTITTFAGSLLALAFSTALVKTFSGKGLVPDALVGDPGFVAVVTLAAASTVLLATWLSIPISTTHALMGALVGAGAVLAGGAVDLSVLGGRFALPLLLSPLAAVGLTGALYPLLRAGRRRLGIERDTCVCVGETWVPVSTLASGEAVATRRLNLGVCRERYSGTVLAVDAHKALDAAHYMTAGAVSLARGMNDTPKIVALLLAARALEVRWGLLLVGLAMAAGAFLQARKVAETMGYRVTPMNHGQGFSANLVTAGLVIAASGFGLPVSTTHVSCGSLFGIGAVTHQARWATIGKIMLSWVVTLPLAGSIAAAAAMLL